MLKKIFLSLFLCMYFLGCSQTPKPTGYGFSTQKKMQANHHWNALAKDIGQNVVARIKQKKTSNISITLMPNNNSPFCRAFRSFLITHFINSGIDIKNEYDSDYQLYWAVQGTTHKNSRTKMVGTPGGHTSAALLVYGLYKIFEKSTAFAQVAGTGIVFDIAYEIKKANLIDLPKNEIIINVSLKNSDKIEYRSSNIYYINDLDTDHYHFTKDQIGIDPKFNQKTFKISN